MRKFWNKHLWVRRVSIGFGALCLVVIGLQLVFPHDRVLPFAQINGRPAGLADIHAVEKLAADTPKQKLQLKIADKTVTDTVGAAGASADSRATLQAAANYPWYWRVVPFSSVVMGLARNEPVQVKVHKPTVEKFYTKKAKELCTVPARDATLKANGETVELVPARNGTACPVDSIVKQLDAQVVRPDGLSHTLKLTTAVPDRSNKDVQSLLTTAKAIVATPLTVTVADKNYVVPKATVASWLMFTPNDKNELVLDASADSMKKYFETIQKDIYIKPGVTTITTRDGAEVARTPGAPGRGIDDAKSAANIKQAMLQKTGKAELVVANLPPTEQYNRSYSNTPEGLRALVNDLSKANSNMAISVRKLGDSGVHANGDQQYHPASTYKLYVAYSVLKRIDSGEWTWDKPTSHGSVAQCFDKMIINSDNPCAEWFGGTVGWSKLFSEVRALGLQRTAVTSGGFVSTTNDLALFLQKLEAGQLGISEPSRARLLDVMKRQVYRKGIPAGANGVVADKVGFLDDMLHDAAIVYSPKGVYVITIMSKGSSWEAIAAVTRAVDAKINE